MQGASRESATRSAVAQAQRRLAASAGQPSAFRDLQRRAGNRAVARQIALRPVLRARGGDVHWLQRDIAFGALAGAMPPSTGVGGLGFYRVLTAGLHPTIKRATLIGPWASVAVPAGQERNHIVSYLLIAEALNNVAQKIYADAYAYTVAAPGAGHAAKAKLASQISSLEALTESLYPGGAPPGEHKAMLAERSTLVSGIIAAANQHPPGGAQQQQLGALATRLESRLTSAPENIRLDDAAMNKSIGSNIDPQLHNQFANLLAAGNVQNLPPGVSAP
ncbi:MAG TPA: hypothetical protein VK252_07255, partial [Solirubrobacteraceae bacterium]|nr:hypothetical protein [Solirubrobacteraceae bacterium]